MRYLALVALLVGCGGSVDPEPARVDSGQETAADVAPRTCPTLAGRYLLKWTRKTGACVMNDRETVAPYFDCGTPTISDPELGTWTKSAPEGDACRVTGQIVCTNGSASYTCTTSDFATVTCEASVAMADCSGVFGLVMERLD